MGPTGLLLLAVPQLDDRGPCDEQGDFRDESDKDQQEVR